MSAKQVERLEKTLARVAGEKGLDQERLRRWVSFLALCGVLEQAVERGVIDTYYLKGGVAMELPFARAARTTKDFDLGLEGNRAERIRRLGHVLQLEFDAFTFRLKPEIHEMELADTVRVEVAVQYKTRAWQTVEIDLGPGGARDVDLVEPVITGLAEMGLPMAAHVRCLDINEQVAQKLHACTGPQREDRARDVLDILLVDMLGQLDYARTRAAAEQIFAERATHPFPPTYINLEDHLHLLYTRGSVEFFNVYLGMYVPHPLRFRSDHLSQSAVFAAQELLALTKMNWNNTQFDGLEPITIRAARQVGSILKYIDDPKLPYQSRYSFYV